MSAVPSRVVSITAAQRINRVACLCALALLFEGYDIASIGYAVPSLVDAWRIQPSVFTQVLTAGNLGLMIGSLVAGWLADRLGRKPVLMGCIFSFGAFSLMSAFAGSPSSLSTMRFLTGLGLGGGLPTVLALASDVAPRTGPERFVILVNVGVPIGFSAGGLLATWLVRAFGWPAIFVVGGTLPLCLLPLLVIWLPESHTQYLPLHQQGQVAALFKPSLAVKTLLLWHINALSYLSAYFILLWMPAILHMSGTSSSRSILATTIYGLGVIASPIFTALVADRVGLERILMRGLIFGASCALLIGLLQPGFWKLSLLLCGVGIGGGCQGGINSLSALSYPPTIRSTGAGWALGAGRIGTIAGPLIGGLLLGLGVRTQYIFVAASVPVFSGAALMAILGRVRSVESACAREDVAHVIRA
jgi:MFS transporter, AAHS family, 4-hydroxybenzoate transporter